MFQSLIGFKINWNPQQPIFNGLCSSFQSLIGFKINWNKKYLDNLTASPFQSLIGFKINWNEILTTTPKKQPAFQSLIGFKINWNPSRSDFGGY